MDPETAMISAATTMMLSDMTANRTVLSQEEYEALARQGWRAGRGGAPRALTGTPYNKPALSPKPAEEYPGGLDQLLASIGAPAPKKWPTVTIPSASTPVPAPKPVAPPKPVSTSAADYSEDELERILASLSVDTIPTAPKAPAISIYQAPVATTRSYEDESKYTYSPSRSTHSSSSSPKKVEKQAAPKPTHRKCPHCGGKGMVVCGCSTPKHCKTCGGAKKHTCNPCKGRGELKI